MLERRSDMKHTHTITFRDHIGGHADSAYQF